SENALLKGRGFCQAKQLAEGEMGREAVGQNGAHQNLPANELAGYADEAHKGGLLSVGFSRLR
ncbi:MAG: hypothetical protein SLRJCFUN_000059, partial [Candidatus Fervidibacter sp.]